jgi:tRNA(fMet)-specific endonuclease VapC
MEEEIVLCDTDVLIEYFNNNSAIIELLERIGIEKLVVSSITRAEVQQGALDKAHLAKINRVLNKFPTLDLDDHISRCFTRLFEKFILSHKCGIPDMLNAAAAISYNLPFITLNIKDYKYIPDLNIIQHSVKPKRGG